MLMIRCFQPSVLLERPTLPPFTYSRRRLLALLPALIAIGTGRTARPAPVPAVPGPAPALPARHRLFPLGQGAVADISDGDTVTLTDGRIVRLVGIQAPKITLGRRNFAPWPLGQPARDYIGQLAMGRKFRLFAGGRHYDRHGRMLAHMVREDDGLWLQGEMLRSGLARVYTFADNRALAAEMLALEAAARAERAGIWSHPFYALRHPEEAGRLVGTFQIFRARTGFFRRQGRSAILHLMGRGRADQTNETNSGLQGLRARLTAAALGTMPAAFKAALSERGRPLRLRGWIRRDEDGPFVTITHPEQIEWTES